MVLGKNFYERYQRAYSGLSELMESYPRMEAGHHLKENLRKLMNKTQQHSIPNIELIWLDEPNEAELHKFSFFWQIKAEDEKLIEELGLQEHKSQYKFEIKGSKLKYQGIVFRGENFPIRDTLHQAPAFKILYWFSELSPNLDEINSVVLRTRSEGGTIMLVYNCPECFLSNADGLRVIAQPMSELPDHVEDFSLLPEIDPVIQASHFVRAIQGVEKISDAFSQYMNHEERDMSTKRFNAQQEINELKVMENSNLRELFQEMKSMLQRDFTEFENGINEQIFQLRQRHNPGSLVAKIDEEVKNVRHLEEETFAGNLIMTLPSGTKDHILKLVDSGLRSSMNQGVVTLKEFLKHEMALVTEKLKPYGIKPQRELNPDLNLSRIQMNMMEYLRFNQKYEVEKKKLRFEDYLRAALAPFMSVMGLFIVMRFIPGLRKYTTNGKVMGIIGLILGIAAIYSFREFLKNTKQKKEREYETDLLKMRDNLINESKTMIEKSSNEWQKEMSATIREELNNMISALEPVFAKAAETNKEMFQNKQRAVQRRVQGLEQRERTHQTVARNKETYDRSLAQFKGELMNQYQQLVVKL